VGFGAVITSGSTNTPISDDLLKWLVEAPPPFDVNLVTAPLSPIKLGSAAQSQPIRGATEASVPENTAIKTATIRPKRE